MNLSEVVAELKSLADADHLAQIPRYNVPTDNWLGVRAPDLHRMAKKIGKNHELALELWGNRWREARALAFLIADPERFTQELMDEWAAAFDNWGVCDGCCGYLFVYTAHAYKKAFEWADREEEFVRRAGFSLMASLAIRDKGAGDEAFLRFLPVIKRHADDGRNFVKKAVNWALRQIGKRNAALNKAAVAAAEEIVALGTKTSRWIGRDALRELRSEGVQKRLKKK
jgi:3-methyladenine DNA glycosylase AlkD